VDEEGDIVLLEDQDRRLWRREQIAEALALVEEAMRGGASPYALQAAIAAEHCRAAAPADTNWAAIVRYYDALLSIEPSAVVSLNRAVAVAMLRGPQAGLEIIDQLDATGELDRFHLLHAARADLLRRLGFRGEAAKSYQRALDLAANESERRYLARRLREVQAATA
jgi:RNA polymerase sigma-70 factor (ECF subfamily)